MSKKLCIYTIIFVFFDQLVKNLINIFMNVNHSINVISDFFSITYVHNYGAAFSIFNGGRILFILITIIILNIIYLYFIKNKNLDKFELFIYSMLLGGIIGNLIDRVIYGYVIDFLDFKIFGYNFPIFNIADSMIVISVILLFIKELKNEKVRS